MEKDIWLLVRKIIFLENIIRIILEQKYQNRHW